MSRGPDPALAPSKASRPAARIYRVLGATLDPLYGLGGRPQLPPRPAGNALGILHGASAGEVAAARGLRQLLRPRGDTTWWVSTGTVAGRTAGADLFCPRDLPSAVDHFFEHLRPQHLVLLESELWPNLLAGAQRRGVAVGVAGARISEGSFRRLRSIGEAFRRWTEPVRAFAAASDQDAERLRGLGVEPGRIEVCGWIKWPEPPSTEAVTARRAEVEGLFAPQFVAQPLLVLGSAHPREVAATARALEGTDFAAGQCRWLVVQRHPRTKRALLREIRRHCPEGSAHLEERMGLLMSWYAVADRCVVGGGHSGRGLHNVLEPLILGRRPGAFLRTSDPAGFGHRLRTDGLLVDLEASKTLRGCWANDAAGREDLKNRISSYDGREAALSFLEGRGVLPC